jgi:flagellum-specific peptidoglycan hydrolase FlgJ
LISRWYQDYEGYSGVNNASSIEEAAQMLVNQGYATDPEYAQKLMRIIRQNS